MKDFVLVNVNVATFVEQDPRNGEVARNAALNPHHYRTVPRELWERHHAAHREAYRTSQEILRAPKPAFQLVLVEPKEELQLGDVR